MNRVVKRTSHRQTGFSLIELLIVIAIILIIMGIAVPKYVQFKMSGYELAAMSTMKAVDDGQAMYFSLYGRFAQSLEELGPPASGAAGPSAADLIPGELAKTGEGSGYKYILAATPSGYTLNANPTTFGVTGRRTFFSDQSLTIHQHFGAEPASLTDPQTK